VTLDLTVTTNGTTLTEFALRELKSNNFTLTISGDAQFQKVNRAGRVRALDNVAQIVRAIDVLGSSKVNVRATLTGSQSIDMAEVFDFYTSCGATNVFIGLASGKPVTISDIERNVRGIAALYHHCASVGVYEGYLEQAYGRLISRDLASSYCSAGGSHVVLNSSGELSSCANVTSEYQNAQLSKAYTVDSDPVCGECFLRYMCSGGCRAWRVLQDQKEPDHVDCSASAARLILAMDRRLRSLSTVVN
jgi:radical SAM protein with 4Fe4S-binding SPASM domain